MTGYYVEKKSGTRWVKVNKKPTKNLTLELSDLIEKEQYEFRVLAENDAGVGKPCDPIRFVAKDPYDVPGQPGRPIIDDITTETADLTWAAPDSDGGSTIVNYIIEMRVLGEVKWKRVKTTEMVPDLKFTVPGLTAETQYEFRVTAENKAGQGPPSEPSLPAKYSK